MESMERVAQQIRELLELEPEAVLSHLEAHPSLGEEAFLLEALALAERMSVSADAQAAARIVGRLHQIAEHTDSPHQIATHLSLGRHAVLQGQRQQAQAHYLAAQELIERFDQDALQGALTLERASLAIQAGAHHDAHPLLARAQAFFEAAEDPFGQSQVLLSQGQLLHLEGRLDEAQAALDACLELQREGSDDPIMLANALLSRGALFQAQGKYSEAEDAYQSALPLYQSARDPRGLANACKGLGLLYKYLGDRQGAEAALQNALQLFQQIHAKAEIASIYRELAALYQEQGRSDEAQSFLRQAELLSS